MYYLIVDLEATCWPNNPDKALMETIEIGAVLLDETLALPAPEFQRFIRPQAEPVLSEFCTQLTSITQADVDAAEVFATVFAEFTAWAEAAEPVTFCSWGIFDHSQLKKDCARWGLAFPPALEKRLNLKHTFKKLYKEQVGMAGALKHLNLELQGTHHRGIDDARNLARIAQVMLPLLLERTAPPAPGGPA